MLYLGTDHQGFQHKERLKHWLESKKIPYKDLGAFSFQKADDYPDVARLVAQAVQEAPSRHRGILLCGSGVGVSIVANKFCGIRAALCATPAIAKAARTDDNSNVLALPASFLSWPALRRIVSVWLTTPFCGLFRYKRRIEKIYFIERV
jgi:ribose 5-phosphate isomerase B